jgi:osmotically inducible protein OsmC
MIGRGTAVWRGDGLHGKGALTTQSGVLRDQPFSFRTQFQDSDGGGRTSPQELLGAAHAGCYAIALAFTLVEAGCAPSELEVSAALDLERVEKGFAIRSIALELQARVPGLDPATFQAAAEGAKKTCFVFGGQTGIPISLSAKLI